MITVVNKWLPSPKYSFVALAMLLSGGCVGEFADMSNMPELPRQCIGGNCDWVYDGDLLKTSETAQKPHGLGTMRWPDGRQYSGSWSHGKMQGTGVFSWPDGRTYNGQIMYNFMHGPGVMTWNNRGTYTGQFAFGQMVAPGTFTTDDGTRLAYAKENLASKSATLITWPEGHALPIRISVLLKKQSKRAEVWELVETQGEKVRRMTIELRPNGFSFIGDINRDYDHVAVANTAGSGVFIRSSHDGALWATVLAAETLDDIKFAANLTNTKYAAGVKQYKTEITGMVSDVKTYNRTLRAKTYTLKGRLVGRFGLGGAAPTSITSDRIGGPEVAEASIPSGAVSAMHAILHVVNSVDPHIN